jgi:hypothetical protein
MSEKAKMAQPFQPAEKINRKDRNLKNNKGLKNIIQKIRLHQQKAAISFLSLN